MANQVVVTRELDDYIRVTSLREDDVLRELREETALLPAGSAMQVTPEEGQLLHLLAGLVGAGTVLEVGTFTGYATLCLARAVGPGGRVVTCDITGRWPDVGRPYWERAGVADRIDLRVGPAGRTLAALAEEHGTGWVDLVFVDADKVGVGAYFDAAVELVRDGGLVVVDNTLFFGRVVDPTAQDADTVAIREFNASLLTDPRVDISMLPAADGITLARRRPR
ncbi:O-methyltransferase [Saccharothrix yanglingensis]|uniref:SAM-dependent methyltransferase n=1 Tax=Saccharothrix yanglingensis TaxID=659496 RepID=A0ABU0X2R3_9PSEU|nr:class I SAM-dependent methyltransferase [Saccharothrix yanglingensis]MDQ2586415.1 SAM-dependent methyltransferase [Saccharothrix yanglingensis]